MKVGTKLLNIKRNSVWCQINRRSVISIKIWFDLTRFRIDFSVYKHFLCFLRYRKQISIAVRNQKSPNSSRLFFLRSCRGNQGTPNAGSWKLSSPVTTHGDYREVEKSTETFRYSEQVGGTGTIVNRRGRKPHIYIL